MFVKQTTSPIRVLKLVYLSRDLASAMDTACTHHPEGEDEFWLGGVVPPIYHSNGEKPAINPTRSTTGQQDSIDAQRVSRRLHQRWTSRSSDDEY